MDRRRYPLDALALASGCSLSSLGRQLGYSGTTWKQYRDEGVTEVVADRCAVKMGLTPWEVWPDLGQRVCENEHCATLFLPVREGQRFCTGLCRRRTASRRWHNERYATDPEFAEAKREKARRDRAAAGPAARRAEAARKRESYQRHAVGQQQRRRVAWHAERRAG